MLKGADPWKLLLSAFLLVISVSTSRHSGIDPQLTIDNDSAVDRGCQRRGNREDHPLALCRLMQSFLDSGALTDKPAAGFSAPETR